MLLMQLRPVLSVSKESVQVFVVSLAHVMLIGFERYSSLFLLSVDRSLNPPMLTSGCHCRLLMFSVISPHIKDLNALTSYFYELYLTFHGAHGFKKKR